MAEAPVHRDMAKLFGSCFAEKHFLISQHCEEPSDDRGEQEHQGV
jgi:hypothetical protein